MFQLLYVSSAARPMDADTLLGVLQENRSRNKSLGVTGLLLYREGAFMEVIEGDEAAVRHAFEAITDSGHHRDVTLLYEGTAEARSFADWSMSFRALGDLRGASIPGFSPSADAALLAERLPDDADFAEHAVRHFMRTNPQYPDDHTKPA